MLTPNGLPEDRMLFGDAGPLHFGNRAEKVLLVFLMEFFSQERLFDRFKNNFRYVDGGGVNTLHISTAFPVLSPPNMVPAIYLDDGGTQEEVMAIDNMRTNNLESGQMYHKSSFRTAFSVHCIAQERDEARTLAMLVAAGLIVFRRSIYQSGGIDHISPLALQPCMSLKSAENASAVWDCVTMFTVRHELDWVEAPRGVQEEKIGVSLGVGVDYPHSSGIVTDVETDLTQE